MNNIEERIGNNIRQIRKRQGMTLAQLADRYLEETGEVVSGGLIGAWERSEKRISAAQAYGISKALCCSVSTLYDVDQVSPRLESMAVKMYEAMKKLPQKEFEILYHCAIKWEGNMHALIQAAGMYTALNRKDRSEVAFICLHQYEEAQKAGSLLPDAPTCDPEYIESEWIKLLKKKGK